MITRLALAERRWLCDELAARGIDADCVIVADDENLDIAREYGFHTVEVDNTGLGRKFNAGFRYAADQGADYFVHVGSDDWVHPDVFDILHRDDLRGTAMPDPTPGHPVVWRPGERLLVHGRIALVDLGRGLLTMCKSKSRYGVIPWVIPRALLEKTGFAPVTPFLMRGIDGDLMRRIGSPQLVYNDEPPVPCVDFKTALNVTSYEQTTGVLGDDGEEPMSPALSEHFPPQLVRMAEQTHALMEPDEAAPRRRPKPNRSSVWFIVPANGRLEHARVCLTQLARTCATLTDNGVPASAVVIADDENLDTAAELGFATVRRPNAPLGRKWNDGYQLACDPRVNPRPADYAIPFGSDDWIDPRLILECGLPRQDSLGCYRLAAFVNETGDHLARLRIPYHGGIGIRVIPARLLREVGYRPAEEDRPRAIDASVFAGLQRPRLEYRDLHPLQIIDWKTTGTQLNPYGDCLRYSQGESETPWDDLASFYPPDSLHEMRALYGARERATA